MFFDIIITGHAILESEKRRAYFVCIFLAFSERVWF